MFETIPQQNVADWIKSRLLRTPTPAARHAAMNALKAFEQGPWIPPLFAQAVSEIAPDVMRIEGRRVTFHDEPGAVRRDLIRILARYQALADQSTAETTTNEEVSSWMNR